MGGATALVLGAILFSCFSDEFIKLCLGVVPVILLLGGSIVIYLSYVNLSDELNKKEEKEEQEVEVLAKNDDQQNKDAMQAAFWGNTESLIFHDPQCNFAQSKKCTQPFPDKESAILAGYSPCGICEP